MDKISKYKKIYNIFVILMCFGLLDSIVIPAIVKSSGGPEVLGLGLIPVAFYYSVGDLGLAIGIWFINLWFIWGLVAAILKRRINKLERSSGEGQENTPT